MWLAKPEVVYPVRETSSLLNRNKCVLRNSQCPGGRLLGVEHFRQRGEGSAFQEHSGAFLGTLALHRVNGFQLREIKERTLLVEREACAKILYSETD